MKKKITTLLVTCMVFSMVACGAREDANVAGESQSEEYVVESTEIVGSTEIEETVSHVQADVEENVEEVAEGVVETMRVRPRKKILSRLRMAWKKSIV